MRILVKRYVSLTPFPTEGYLNDEDEAMYDSGDENKGSIQQTRGKVESEKVKGIDR